ncbi:MAG: AAA family ATPase [Planctomycetaceae bacterium]|nr:AAA family ATPase [Planctomycetaceae bacterium]
MLHQITIENFRCFPHLNVELRPLTVLIGPNNTGKSAFLAACQCLHNDTKIELTDHWRFNETVALKIRASGDKSSNYSVTHVLDKNRRKQMERGEILKGISLIRLPSTGIACRDQGFPTSETSLPLGENGEHVASVLDYMLRKDRRRFDGVVSSLRTLVPGFEDLVIDTPNPQTRHLKVIADNGLQLPGELLSVGMRHMIFFATLGYHPSAPDVVLVEEPELGVHPKRLGDILSLLRSLSKGEFSDQPAQVILTTHSPFLLDHIDLGQDQLLIFQRDDDCDGARTAQPADQERLDVFLDEFMLGEVWLNEGEKGLVRQ